MGDVVNLHKQRRAQARRLEQVKAEENRVRFGRTKAERQALSEERERERRRHEGHVLTERDKT